MIPVNWLVNDQNSNKNRLLSLYDILGIIEDEQLYTTPFIEGMKELALIHNKEAFNYCFIPFFVQTIFAVIYFSNYVIDEMIERTYVSSIL